MFLALIREIHSPDLWNAMLPYLLHLTDHTGCRKLIKVILQRWQADIVLVLVHPENLFYSFVWSVSLRGTQSQHCALTAHIIFILYFPSTITETFVYHNNTKKVDFGSSANTISFKTRTKPLYLWCFLRDVGVWLEKAQVLQATFFPVNSKTDALWTFVFN